MSLGLTRVYDLAVTARLTVYNPIDALPRTCFPLRSLVQFTFFKSSLSPICLNVQNVAKASIAQLPFNLIPRRSIVVTSVLIATKNVQRKGHINSTHETNDTGCINQVCVYTSSAFHALKMLVLRRVRSELVQDNYQGGHTCSELI